MDYVSSTGLQSPMQRHVMVDMVGCVMVRGVEQMSLQCNVM